MAGSADQMVIGPIHWTRGCGIGSGRARALAAHQGAQTQSLHQLFDGATSHSDALPVHLLPDSIRTMDLHVVLVNTLDLGPQTFIAYRTGIAARRIANLRSMAPVARRGDPPPAMPAHFDIP